MSGKLRHIAAELKVHAPFTVLGAGTGIAFMLLFSHLGDRRSAVLFAVFHPAHVLLSAMVTASLFQLHRKARDFVRILLVGYLGSVGVATVSDSIIPFFGESILGVAIPSHAAHHTEPSEGTWPRQPGDSHEHPEWQGTALALAEEHRPRLHLGFIEEWYLVNPAAMLGILIAYVLPRTRLPHALHVLVSTWASSAHVLMNTQADLTVGLMVGLFVVLFVAVWLPCCISDVVFPMLFVDASAGHRHCWLCRDHGHPSAAPDGGQV